MIRRIAMPKSWPLARKGKHKYVIQPRGNKANSIALVVVLRDLLGLVRTSSEAAKILHAGEVRVNNKKVGDRAFPVYSFDIISLPRIKKYSMLVFKGKKFALQEIKEAEAKKKIYGVIGKKILKKGRYQLNLSQGANFLISAKDSREIKVHDSVLIDLEQNKIEKHLPLRGKAEVAIIGGKHVGEKGKITRVEDEKNLVFIDIKEGEIKVSKEKILVTG